MGQGKPKLRRYLLTEERKKKERVCHTCPVDWISFCQLLEFIDFRHEERRVLTRSRIYHVLLFPLSIPAQTHGTHAFHEEEKHRNGTALDSVTQSKIQEKLSYYFCKRCLKQFFAIGLKFVVVKIV